MRTTFGRFVFDEAQRQLLEAGARRHARVVITASGATIEDLGSKNGTQLRGERISASTRLEDGTEVRVGPVGTID